MNRIMLRALLSAAALGLATGGAWADYELNVLHFNDLHSRIEPINKYDSTCSAEDETEGKCFGGAARLKTAIDERKQALDNVLVLNAGDNFQGSLFYTTYKGDAEAEFLDQMDQDAMVLGNHEFDDGDQVLADFVGKTDFPIIYGNTLIGANSPLAGTRMVEYVIKDVGGEKIGIIGVVAEDTDVTSSPSDAVLFMEPVLYLMEAVDKVKEAGATKVIALTHVGLPLDKKIAAEVDGIDLIVGGHSHTLLSNTDEKAAGPYPVMVKNEMSGKDIPIVQGYAYGKYLGEIKLVFDDDGNLKSAAGDPILLDASFKPNEAMQKRIAELAAPIEEMKKEVVGDSSATIDGERTTCRSQECEMGNLVSDAMLDRVKGQGVQIAIQNGGGLRASIDQGEVTMGEVLTVLPFQNTLSTFQLKGSDVKAALENGVSQLEEGAGRFPQVAGLKYSFDPSKPAGERISDVMVEGGDGSFAAIEDDTTYGVVSNNFMRGGGDGYSVFATAGMNAYDYGPGLEQVVVDYLGENNPYKPYVDGRITEVSAAMEPKADESMKDEMKSDAATMEKDTQAASETVMEKTEEMAKEGMEKVEEAVESATTHVISAGDSLWALAEKYFGDGKQWKSIADANPGQNPKKLEVGSELTIPAKSN